MIPVVLGIVGTGIAVALAAMTSPDSTDAGTLDTNANPIIDPDTGLPIVTDPTAATADNSAANLAAFLATLGAGEGGAAGYGALVGGGSFSDFSHHPGFTSSAMTVKSAWAGAMNSHAAGMYQFEPATFKGISNTLGLAGDFSPASQDAAATELIREQGALALVQSGDIAGACVALSSQWQSLVVRGTSWAVATYQANGGVLA